MRIQKPKSVYIQVRAGKKKFKNFTVYDATFEQVLEKVTKTLSEGDRPKSGKLPEPSVA